MQNKPWLKNYDQGVPHSIEYPAIPLFGLLEESAKKYPERVCTIFKGAETSYKEMDDYANRLAAAFHGLGIKKGDRVGLFMPNTPQFVMAYYGLLKAGAVVVATNPLYTEREIIYQVNDAGVEHMVLMTNNYEKVKAIQDQTRIKQIIVTNLKEALPPVTRILFTLLKEKKSGFRVTLRDNDVWMPDLLEKYSAEDRPELDITPQDTALFQYSGGTTGISKGVVASHEAVVANSCQIASWNPTAIEGAEIICMAIPLYHVYGMVAGLNYGLLIGATFVMVPDPRNMTDVLENLSKYKATIYPGVPAMYNAINNNEAVAAGKYDLSSVKFCISGSAALLRETKLKFEEITGGNLVEGYGLSEAPTASHCNPVVGDNRPGSIGLPLPDVECKVVDLEDGVTELAPGEIGELLLKGPQVMKGYHNMPTETENALRDGWLYTGDIVYMDEDGYFYIVDRKKELIKPGGFQVWPREIEEVLATHPKIFEAGVAGIPDADSGEAVKAWIVFNPGESATKEEILEFCRKDLARYKVPKQIEFVEELPRSTVGKILRRELVRMHKEEVA
ncbi:MAG: long-chain fatty acid--CoA ligase [Chloroflexi bacterium]|jgi:long-chain acyl-CoA synthetase|nr:long-chain fatty acid--CoA ligase [Chloroflexota bacterium]MBT3668701.1 long-chain fatty acid--CoA ligase [Chloroflexota bacterium]MBT4305402.1 long-chain fatty acid--CoA ligase [Chloroflexota bacterium]MBT4532548.1 long-chain fatty acid--CoA ligase [Chloroflexota bacterium]MBT4683209.1 long-chain fatty acid--CoA ligase [Chloroflexota bacterium]